MRIEDSSSVKDMEKKSSKGSSLKKMVSGLFEKELSLKQAEPDDYAVEVEQLKKEIDFYGDTLSREPTLANFKKFRELLSQLAKRVGNEAYRLEKIGGTPLNPRYFEVIKVINREAEQLYSLIIQEQRNNMAITAKVIGIKGLVVDLLT